jgi:chemotaxis protein histidine kinase CheA
VSIGADQSFDHINSINRILASYIENSFQYKEADSDTLATYVLYYNAAHRKDTALFAKRYNENVNQAIDGEKVGIDTSYKNWPGKTEIVIPISGNILKDGGTDVTTDELEEEVDRLVKTEKDQDSKKRMQEEASKMDKLQQEKLAQEKKEVDKRKEDLAKKEDDLKKQQEANQNKLAETGKILQDLRKDPVKNATKIAEKEKEVEKLQETQAKIEEEKKQVAQTKEELEKKEQEIVKKEETRKESSDGGGSTATSDASKTEEKKEDKKPEEKVQDLEKELAQVRDELKKKEEKSENVIDNKIFFMKFIKYDSDGHYSNELWAIDPVKDDTLFKSPFTNICSKEFIDIPNQGILVLGYEGTKIDDRKHKLTYLDTKTLKLKKQSDASDVFWRTPMVYTDDKIYVIEKFENNYHLTRFNPDLTVDVRSSAPVEENSEITFFKDKIYITGKGKGEGKTTIKIFARSDLKMIKTLSP